MNSSTRPIFNKGLSAYHETINNSSGLGYESRQDHQMDKRVVDKRYLFLSEANSFLHSEGKFMFEAGIIFIRRQVNSVEAGVTLR